MPTNEFIIYYDSLSECIWFQGLHPSFANAQRRLIGTRTNNPPFINSLLLYDKPDIILTCNDEPVLVIEKTSEVPTGHNVGQRFARLVRAVELGVTTICFFPFDSRKHGLYSSICNLNIRFIKAAQKMYQIHNTPLLAVNWQADNRGELVNDGSEDDRLKEILGNFVSSGFNKNCNEIINQLEYMSNEYARRLLAKPSYARFPNSVLIQSTDSFLSQYRIANAPMSIVNRPNTLVYKIEMTPDSCKRQDPYTGMQFIYDYISCRTGTVPSDKHNNLVLHFPHLTQSLWNSKNPNNLATKSSNWYLTANILLFADGYCINIP
ncbi:MAG: hypothetical protein FWE45_00530 [Firmicutes bacterium]|nr:hypothetical protein [Bacillota bacterium]